METQSRRKFCFGMTGVLVTLPVLTKIFAAADFSKPAKSDYVSLSARQNDSDRIPLSSGKRVPFGMDYFSLTGADNILLKPVQVPAAKNKRISLRLQIAVGMRDQEELEVFLGNSDRKIGQLSIKYGATLQIFETQLDAPVALIIQEGVTLRMPEGKTTLFFLKNTSVNGSHFLLHDQAQKGDYLAVLCSFRSLQPFGWQEGCVLDGLQQLYERKNNTDALKTIQDHLSMFLTPDGKLVYEVPSSLPMDGQINNIEFGLPFSVISRYHPDHPSVKIFIDFCRERIGENGQVKENFLSTEGCYTLAYPLAAAARDLRQPELYTLVLTELELRIKHLSDREAVYTRSWKDKNTKTYRNWGRGYAWFLLGLVSTGEILQNDPEFKDDDRIQYLKETFIYYAKLALSHQQPDHGWRAYIDLAETGYDCSATAGIGAALAHGSSIGWFDVPKSKLKQIRNRLSQNLTPDGLLNGICQNNAGGEQLQKGEYRVISLYVLGLMAHLDAHC